MPESTAPPPDPLRRVLTILWPERRDLGFVFLYALCVAVLSLAVPITATAVVNSVALTALVQQLIVLCIALAVALGLAAVIQSIQQVVVEYVQRRVFVRIAGELAERLPRVELSAYDEQHGPELVNRFFDVLTVQKASATLLMDGIALMLQILIGLLLLATYDRILLGFDAILIAGLMILFLLGRGGARTAISESTAKYRVVGWLEEVALHPVSFKLAGGPKLAFERTDALTAEYLHARAGHFRVVFRQICFGLLLQVIASVALLAVGGHLVIEGSLTLGQLVGAQIVVNLVVSAFSKLGKQLESWYDLLAGSTKVGQLLDLPLEEQKGLPLPGSGPCTLTLREISFHYEGSTRPVFENYSLSIAAGERVALLGSNGSGKSTLIELIFGMRRPEHGWIEIDGVDVRDLHPLLLRDSISLARGVEVFDGTVADNVRVGRPDIPIHDVREALRQTGLLEDLLVLPDGLETRLVTGGSPLSLGQLERLMIARAIVGKPRLLVLDEILDTIHSTDRERVLAALFAKDAPWTLIIITHNPRVAELCSRQVRLETPQRADPC